MLFNIGVVYIQYLRPVKVKVNNGHIQFRSLWDADPVGAVLVGTIS